MKKIVTLMASFFLVLPPLLAQENTKNWYSNINFSGYVMTQYQYSNQDNNKANSFNIRMARMSLDGRIASNFYWKTQIQINGNTSTLGQSPRVVDLFVEWQKYDFFKVKAGEFKRPFTFENPMNPIDQGFMAYSQVVNKLSGFSDRVGEHASNGRDIGVQIQGDLLKNTKGRNLLHYQIGVFNGQGINVKDVDQRKDLIGGIWIMPISGMRIGAFGWTGTYARKGSWKNENGQQESGVRSLDKNRYALSLEYKKYDWSFRTEYIHSTGASFATSYDTKADLQNADINTKNGDKADGCYALMIAPILKKKLYVKTRYDLYKPSKLWNNSRTQYEIGANYLFNKNIQINAEYALINDRSLSKSNYDIFDVQLDFRF